LPVNPKHTPPTRRDVFFNIILRYLIKLRLWWQPSLNVSVAQRRPRFDDSLFLTCDTAWICNPFPTFRNNTVPSSIEVQNSNKNISYHIFLDI